MITWDKTPGVLSSDSTPWKKTLYILRSKGQLRPNFDLFFTFPLLKLFLTFIVFLGQLLPLLNALEGRDDLWGQIRWPGRQVKSPEWRPQVAGKYSRVYAKSPTGKSPELRPHIPGTGNTPEFMPHDPVKYPRVKARHPRWILQSWGHTSLINL